MVAVWAVFLPVSFSFKLSKLCELRFGTMLVRVPDGAGQLCQAIGLFLPVPCCCLALQLLKQFGWWDVRSCVAH